MAKPAFSCRTLSLKKTKLGESDLIVTALREDGSLLRGVAKGARKPTNQFSSRLEIFSVCDCLVAQGKSLDVFSEARCVEPHLRIRSEIDRNIAASPVVEAIAACTHEDLEIPRLFDMSCAVLDAIERVELRLAPSLTAAFLVKLVALIGYRPCFSSCVSCSEAISLQGSEASVAFSFFDGGALCPACASAFETTRIDPSVLAWSEILLNSTFSQVVDYRIDPQASFAVLHLMQVWFREVLSANLKSLSFMLTCGLF